MLQRFLSSPRLHGLFRIGWLERAIFLTIRFIAFRFGRPSLAVLRDTLFGFDFSKWQSAIDFARVFVFGAKFIILRAAYGLTLDERFLEYMQTAPDYFGGRLSVYGYYYPHLDPVAQANKLIEVIAPFRHFIRRVWGDFEFSSSGNYSASSHWKRYAETILAAGYPFGVYTRKTWWDSRVGNLASWFGQFPLWAAQYAPNLTMIPTGWSAADLHQKGTPAIGHEVGTVGAEVDYNIADDEFYVAEYGGITEPPPSGGSMSWYEVNTNALNIRKGPGTTYLDVGDLFDGDKFESSEELNGWLHVIRIFRVNGILETPTVESWCKGSYCIPTTAPSIPPDVPPPVLELPLTWDVTQVARDENGQELATYRGTLTKE